jgi:Flp pilus assembly protein TadG
MLRFRDDERGSMSLIIIFTFLAMIIFGGIAVDVMRFETRRVAMQQTLDRAALAASGLPDTDDLSKVRTPTEIANDWFAKTNLDEGLFMVEYSTPTVSAINIPGKREVTMSASVTSHNFFMGIFSPRDYLQAPTATKAAQGVTNIEVILVLDITGSMGENISAGKTKLKALQEAANSFVDIVKGKDTKNGVSIGVVPYAAQVNAPLALRQQFNETNVSSWNGVPNAGVPNINCLEFPTSSFNTTAFPLTTPVPMAAVADSNSGTTTDGTRVAPQAPSASARACTTNAETGSTPWVDAEVNQILLPTKDATKVKQKIDRLTAQGNTYIAVGMRWGTALIDQAARPIYTNLLAGEPAMAGRPADNGSGDTRKIIVLMTDGEHVTNNHVRDAYKSGPSPIWRGADGNFAIRFINPASPAAPIRPGSGTTASTSCSGWQLSNYATREYFVPHLKRNSVNQKQGSNPEGAGTGASVANACDPQAWLAAPSWSGSGTAVRLDWSEVWRYVRVSWVAQQLYVRSGVTGWTDYNTNMNLFRTTYLTSVSNMNNLLQQNCAIARKSPFESETVAPFGKGTGVEIYGIMFDDAPSTGGIAQIKGCASEPKTTYYYEPKSTADLLAAFNQIATDISDLRLTQ